MFGDKIRYRVLLFLCLLSSALTASSANGGADRPKRLLSGPVVPLVAPLSLIDDRGRNIRLDLSPIASYRSPRVLRNWFSPPVRAASWWAPAGTAITRPSGSVPEIGDASGLDFERILALKPDLVIAWHSGSMGTDIAKLEKLGLTVFAAEAARLDDIPRLLRAFGTLAGTYVQADSAAGAYEEELRRIKGRYGTRNKISVFQLIWDQPLMTINAQHMAKRYY